MSPPYRPVPPRTTDRRESDPGPPAAARRKVMVPTMPKAAMRVRIGRALRASRGEGAAFGEPLPWAARKSRQAPIVDAKLASSAFASRQRLLDPSVRSRWKKMSAVVPPLKLAPRGWCSAGIEAFGVVQKGDRGVRGASLTLDTPFVVFLHRWTVVRIRRGILRGSCGAGAATEPDRAGRRGRSGRSSRSSAVRKRRPPRPPPSLHIRPTDGQLRQQQCTTPAGRSDSDQARNRYSVAVSVHASGTSMAELGFASA